MVPPSPSMTLILQTDKTEEVRRLGMGRLLADLSRKMHLKVNETERVPKLLLHSTHDTALAGLMNTLDVFDDRYVLHTSASFRVAARAVWRTSRHFRAPRISSSST